MADMQPWSAEAPLPDLPDSVLWDLARLLPSHQIDGTAHQTFCLLGSSWLNAYCSSRQDITLHLGPTGLWPIASRVLEGSGSMVTRLEVRMHWLAPAQLPHLIAVIRALPKLQALVLANSSLGTEGMVALAPTPEYPELLGQLRELDLRNNNLEEAGAAAALASILRRLSSLQRLRLSGNTLCAAGAAALAPAIQQLTELLSLDMGAAAMAPAIQHLTSLQDLSLDVRRLGVQDMAALAQSLGQLGSLDALTLSCCRLQACVGLLAPAIGDLAALRRLRLIGDESGGSSLDAEGVAALASALAGLAGLQLLDISRHNMGRLSGGELAVLALALQQLTALTALDLHANHLAAGAAAALAPAVAQLPALRLLDVSRNDAGAALLLRPLSSLRRLELGHSSMGAGHTAAGGVELLAAALAPMVRLLHLDLQGNNLGARRNLSTLAPALFQLVRLQHLELGDNSLGPWGVEALAPALKVMTGLRHLGLDGNGLGARGAVALAPLLWRMPGLQRLGLGRNLLGMDGATMLAPALARMVGLQQLNFSGNALGVQGVVRLAAAGLAHMTGLQHLDLSFSEARRCTPAPAAGQERRMGVQGATALAAALVRLTGLTHPDLSGSRLDEQGVAVLTSVLEGLAGLQHAHFC